MKYIDIIRTMSYKANVDVVIAFNALQISSFRKQGFLRFKVALIHQLSNPKHKKDQKYLQANMAFCSPYNIYKKPRTMTNSVSPQSMQSHSQGIKNLNLRLLKQHQQAQQQSYIDHDQECYYSKILQSKFQSQHHQIEECVYFRKYIDTDQLQISSFRLKIQLLFRPNGEQNYIEAGSYEATIHRLSGFATYLPVQFDQFGGFSISAIYQATLLEYKFEGQSERNAYASFQQYLLAATMGLHPNHFLQFFNYYRGSLETELQAIQERHTQLLNITGITQQFHFIKITSNQAILNLSTYLGNPEYFSNVNSRAPQKYSNELKERLCEQISKDFVFIKSFIHQKWNDYIIYLCTNIPILTEYFRRTYIAHVKERLKSHAFSHRIQPKWDWTMSRYADSGKELLNQARLDKLKNKEQQLWREEFPIETSNFFEQEGKTIKIFEQIYQVKGQILTQRSLSPTATNRTNLHLHSYPSAEYSRPCSPQGVFHPQHHAKYPQDYRHFIKHSPEPFGSKGTEKPKVKLQRSKIETPIKLEVKDHVVIFVHGFQASRQDFILFKSCLEIKYGCRVFISSTNQGRTDQSIQILGKRLAIELNHFFKAVQFGSTTRISFVGHSMGGIIIRSALSYIKNLQPYLYSYMSFSSPHLGYLYQPSTLVQAGLWLMNAFQKIKSLQELCMRDSNDPRKSLLYRLSENNTLRGFRQLALISSSQDEYVPYESARIQKNEHLLQLVDSQSVTIIKEMVDNLLGEIDASELSRMNVVFNIQDNNFDSLVGRTAHIKYLSDQKFIKMFCLVFQKFFA